MSVAVTTDYIAARRAALPAFPIAVTVNVDIEWSDIRSAGSAGLFGKFSYGRYGLREGFWRILEVLKVAGVPATFFVAPDDMGRHPSIVDDILRAGHEIAALGRILEKPEQTGDGDLSSIEAAQAVFRRFTGSNCAGWRTACGWSCAPAPPARARTAAAGPTRPMPPAARCVASTRSATAATAG